MVTIHIEGHRVQVIDGTHSEGIGQLGPYAVIWCDENYLRVASTDDSYTDGYGAVTWLVVHEKKTGHTHWERAGTDD
jgi:hypothetical protein